MPSEPEQQTDINSWLAEELYQDYVHNHASVDESWKDIFAEQRAPKKNGAPIVEVVIRPAPPAAAPAPVLELSPSEQLVPLRGASARLAENMTASLSVPMASSQRVIPVKVIDENRRILNHWRELHGKSKLSYTHFISWAIVKAIKAVPALNHAYHEVTGQPHRIVRNEINIGVAVDLAGKDGQRQLFVPNVKNAGALSFGAYRKAFDDIVARARGGKLTVDDFKGTTISITNPGTVGTVGSVPRLMPGQGAIIATGAIDYPAEFRGVSDEVRAALGIAKVMTVTSTYDHRVIQGAESGVFLGKLQALLEGEEGFYDEIFAQMHIPYQPVRWQGDKRSGMTGFGDERRLDEIAKQAAVFQLINAYRVRGHLLADLDPLGVEQSYHPELDPATYGLSIWDLEREFITNIATGTGRAELKTAPLREIIETLRQTYCGKIGCEYMNIQHPEEKRWWQERMEPVRNNAPLDEDLRRRVLLRLLQGESFENFLHTRFVGQKRFSLEGGESAMVILDELLERASVNGVAEIAIGMAHRGRLNVLANLVGKTMAQVFGEFEGNLDPEMAMGSGDVKYHLGASGIIRTVAGKEIKVSLSPNPSHLEAVDPVIEGIVRAKQNRMGDTKRERVLPVLVHGDAAFAGQGVVGETLNLSQLAGYTTGGTIHLIINNQIGFTTPPEESRSTPYCTDIARTVQAPIFHVNGDDPEACIRAIQMAFDFRQKYKKDVVIDMICYRKYGHNEGDDPSFTQPTMYRQIKMHDSVAQQYTARLLRQGTVTKDWVERTRKSIHERMNEAHEEAVRRGEKWELQEVTEFEEEEIPNLNSKTAVSQELIERVVEGLTSFPDDFRVHPKLKPFIERRREMLTKNTPADWAFGEALACGSLLVEGTPVRLSGQDSGRGTFSQRHIEYRDYDNARLYIPMQHLAPNTAKFEVWDSSLSEYGVMGFEFGYSLGDPLTLVLWEAQFGDFVNGAQIMIDQFISCCEAKWGQPSGLVLLLPHGFEGQGPEHSSARIERFLQMCGENNMQVCNVTTPAQYFHLLRRQMRGGRDLRGVRKPLVIFTPKSMLRHPKAVSRLGDFTGGGFQPVIGDDSGLSPDRASKLLLCSGKIHYELLAERERRDAANVALARLEQMYPFPHEEMENLLYRYPSTTEVVWVQEEPRNMGAFLFVKDRMEPLLMASRRVLHFAGRNESASPATGSLKRHNEEHSNILEDAFAPVMAVKPRRFKIVPKHRQLNASE